MGHRRRARQCALQMLFQVDLTGSASPELFGDFWKAHAAGEDVRRFAERLVRGVIDHAAALDGVLRASAEHWRLERMAVVDRNILRIGAYEILYEPETPPAVVIDEAVEVAKKFGSGESGGFINGILDDVRRRVASGEIASTP